MEARSCAPVDLAAYSKTETRNGCTNPGFEEAAIGNQLESLRLSVIVAEDYRLVIGTTSESWALSSRSNLCWLH